MQSVAIDLPKDDNAKIPDLSAGMNENDNKSSLLVSDLGAIARYSLPPHWEDKSQARSEWAEQGYSRDFSPADDAGVNLSIYFRGMPVSQSAADKFRALISDLPHELSAAEINSIGQILAKMADEDAFLLRSAHTTDISGRRALLIDGEWKTSKTQFYGLMIEVDESREIQEIYFEAKNPGFMKYLSEVVDSIRAIEWKGQ